MMKVFRLNCNYLAACLGAALVAICCLCEIPSASSTPAATSSTDAVLTLPVAMYHHILPQEERQGDYVISPAQFEDDLRYILECGYTPVSARELLSYYSTGAPLPAKPMMITFDDGNESFYEYVYPLLQQYAVPAIVSIIGNQTELYSAGEPTNVLYSYLTWEMLREMQDSGLVEVGNHTYDMHSNTPGKRYGIRILEGETQEQYQSALWGDIGRLSQRMTEELGEAPTIFAYPFGALCRESRPILQDMGFRIILTCAEQVNQLPLSNGSGWPEEGPIVLGRFNRAHRYSTYEYCKKLGILPPT